MKKLLKKHSFKLLSFVIIGCLAFAGTAKAGLDHYEIYLGKKLIMKRALNEQLNLQALPVSEANANERLVIHYFQCNAPDKNGTNRSIVIKDGSGKTLKEWKFADVKNSQTGMEISIKDLLQLQQANKNKELNIYYVANGKEQGQKLALLKSASKSVTYLDKKAAKKV